MKESYNFADGNLASSASTSRRSIARDSAVGRIWIRRDGRAEETSRRHKRLRTMRLTTRDCRARMSCRACSPAPIESERLRGGSDAWPNRRRGADRSSSSRERSYANLVVSELSHGMDVRRVRQYRQAAKTREKSFSRRTSYVSSCFRRRTETLTIVLAANHECLLE